MRTFIFHLIVLSLTILPFGSNASVQLMEMHGQITQSMTHNAMVNTSNQHHGMSSATADCEQPAPTMPHEHSASSHHLSDHSCCDDAATTIDHSDCCQGQCQCNSVAQCTHIALIPVQHLAIGYSRAKVTISHMALPPAPLLQNDEPPVITA